MAKIVLVDDHILLRNGLAALVKKIGHHVLFESNNGKEFISQLDVNNLPDIILMDLKMPLLNGVEATRLINSEFAEINIIALSSYNSKTFIAN